MITHTAELFQVRKMRAVWREDVRILIIDEISVFKASDVEKFDRQLKKLTGRLTQYMGECQ